jgi:hypothetical protein
MDPNGTRFHLLKGESDWRTCREEGQTGGWTSLTWNQDSASLGLRPLLALFPRFTGTAWELTARRGAALDRFGNPYWIAADRRQLVWHPTGARQPLVYWTQALAPRPAPPNEFHAAIAEAPPVVELGGLAITDHHYLVVGNVTQGGVFVFDLHAGGDPLRLLFPETARFTPFDMVAAPGGGVWILDRRQRRYWGLDREFRIVAAAGPAPADQAPPFHPVGGPAASRPGQRMLAGFPVAAQDPISIEALADGSVLILDRRPAPAASLLYRYRGEHPVGAPIPLAIKVAVEPADADAVDLNTELLSLVAHDIACDRAAQQPTLYVVDNAGKQVFALMLNLDASPALTVKPDFLPLHSHGGRGLVWDSVSQAVFYDLSARSGADTATRWVRLRLIEEPAYVRQAVILTPLFDGKEHNCVWDGLFLDACIPPGTRVKVSTWADNNQELIEQFLMDAPESAPFSPEPELYLRGVGAELPYYDPFIEQDARRQVEAQAVATPPRPEGTGTWELLFQRGQGRYLQIRLELRGNGRSTPRLYALRAYYPRFSYPKNYLPAVFLDDPISAGFLERLLANPKGFFTEIEARIDAVSLLFDPRGAPSEALEWLAGWIGLTLDPLWSELHKRRPPPVLKGQDNHPPPDRRRLLIRFATRLYAWRGTLDGLLFALELLLDPCLEAFLARIKKAAVADDPGLRARFQRLNLPYPTVRMTEARFEELLFAYVVSPRRHAKVRIVERFRVRDGRAAALGDPTPVSADTAADFSHRFSVLIPEDLSPAEEAMVRRIVELEKPAHTAYDVRFYWDYFRVGEARLGIDTIPGESGRFVSMILGRQALAAGYLEAAPPLDAPDRLILNRDPVGSLPPL